MSTETFPTTAKSSVSDDHGSTRVPKDIRDEMSVERGDKLKWVYKDGDLIVVVE